MKQRNPADYPSVDEVLQELEGSTAASASALEQDLYGQYAWEREVERSWECLVEAEGQLRVVGGDEQESLQERQGLPTDAQIRRALLRSVVILIDATDGMKETDFKPDRLTCATQLLEDFLASFLLQNPLAQIALVFMADSAAEVLCPASAALASEATAAGLGAAASAAGGPSLPISFSSYFSSNVDELVTALVTRRRKRNLPTAHAPSLKNGLDRARALLGAVPPYCTREVLVLYGSIRTCDVGSIDDSIEELKKLRARCSVISLAPEVRILRALASQTEGSFGVALHRDHLRSLLQDHTQPPAWLEGLQPCLIRVGFPSFKESSTAALCSCHNLPRFRAYTCPLCSAKLCDLPCRCLCCSLHLLSPADVSRSFHSLCLPQPFERVGCPLRLKGLLSCVFEAATPAVTRLLTVVKREVKDFPRGCKCCCCEQPLDRASRCPECQNFFCRQCDAFSHEQLRHCPFCVMDDVASIGDEADNEQNANKNGSSHSLR